MRLLLPLFIITPILEIALLIQVGGMIGLLPTVALVVLTAVVGIALLRQQGFSTWLRLQQRLATGELPATELVEGAMLLVGGALLLTPGFVTDAIGFSCLIPVLRRPLARRLIAALMARAVRFPPPGHASRNSGAAPRPGNVTLDGEFRETPPDRDRLR